MALTTGQLLSGAGGVSRGMRRAEEAERLARQNQLQIEAQNRADEIRRQTAQAQAGLQVPNVPQFAGMTGGQQVGQRPQQQQQPSTLGIPVPSAPAAIATPVNMNVPEATPIKPITSLTQRPPSGAIGPATYPEYGTSPFERGVQQVGQFLSEEDERRTLTQQLERQYGRQGGFAGLFMPQTAEEREQAQQISALLRSGQLSLPQLRELSQTGRLPDLTPEEPAAPQAGLAEPATAPAKAPAEPTEEEVATTPQPRSMRNNNPGNLIFNDYTRGLGATGQDKDGFAIFPSVEAGQQATIENLRNYGRRGINTVSGVINRWAPPNAPGNSAESTNNYVNYVAGKLGVNPDTPIDMNNEQVLAALSQGIAEFESGHTSPLVGKQPQQTADRVATAASAPASAAAGVMYGPSEVPGGMQNPGIQSALMLRQMMAERYRIASEVGSPDVAMEALAQITAIDLGLYKAQGDLGVQELITTGDASRAMSVLSQFSGIPTQALARGDGTFDIYRNGRVTQTAVPVGDLADLIRTTIDAEYRRNKTELAAEQSTIQLEQGFEIQKKTLDALKDIRVAMIEGNLDIAKEIAKREGSISVDSTNGVAYLRQGGRTLVVSPDEVQIIAGVEQRGPVAREIQLP